MGPPLRVGCVCCCGGGLLAGWGAWLCCSLPPHPGLPAVSAGLRAFVSWLVAIQVLDVVCFGPVSLPPFGFRIAGLLDVVCLGPVSRFPCFRPFGLPDVVCLWTYLCLPDFFLPLG